MHRRVSFPFLFPTRRHHQFSITDVQRAEGSRSNFHWQPVVRETISLTPKSRSTQVAPRVPGICPRFPPRNYLLSARLFRAKRRTRPISRPVKSSTRDGSIVRTLQNNAQTTSEWTISILTTHLRRWALTKTRSGLAVSRGWIKLCFALLISLLANLSSYLDAARRISRQSWYETFNTFSWH